MCWSGPILLLFIVYHLAPLHPGHRPPPVRGGRRLPQRGRGLPEPVRLGLLRRWPCWPWACTSTTASGACCRPWASATRARTRCAHAPRSCSPRSVVVGNISFPLAVLIGFVHCRRTTMELKSNVPDGPDRREVGEAPLRHEAGEPGQQAQVQRHRGGHRAWPAPPPPPPWPSSATTSSASATRTARAAPTPSPPRAASTPPRTTRTTATASTASSTTP